MRHLATIALVAVLAACATKDVDQWHLVNPDWSTASKEAIFEYCDESTPLPDLNQMVWGADQQRMFDACMRKHGYEKDEKL